MLFFNRKKNKNTIIDDNTDGCVAIDTIDDLNLKEEFISEKKSSLEDIIQYKDIIDALIQNFIDKDNKMLSDFNAKKDNSMELKKIMNRVDDILKLRDIEHSSRPKIKDLFKKYLLGYYWLDDLINDKGISDINCHSGGHITIKRKGKRMISDVKFASDEDYKKFVNYIAVKNEVSLSKANANQTFLDKYTNPFFRLRFTIATEFVSSTDIPYLSIRKIPKEKLLFIDLVKDGMLTMEQVRYFKERAKKSKGVFITGKGASGKTTFYNAFIEELPHNKRGVIIQENDELFTLPVNYEYKEYNEDCDDYSEEQAKYLEDKAYENNYEDDRKRGGHPDLMWMHVVTNNGEGKISYGLDKLTESSLLFDLDIIGVGEIKGREASEYLKVCYTGAVGIGTGHGQSTIDGLNKLGDYIKQATGYDYETCMKMLSFCVEDVVFMEDYTVAEVTRITGWDYERKELIFEKIY